MKEGCCGHSPALSGHDVNNPSVFTMLLNGDFKRVFGEVGHFVMGAIYLVASYIGLMLLGSFLPAACQHIQP